LLQLPAAQLLETLRLALPLLLMPLQPGAAALLSDWLLLPPPLLPWPMPSACCSCTST
jgi:hypothetical protein